jgi:hypothetical protein
VKKQYLKSQKLWFMIWHWKHLKILNTNNKYDTYETLWNIEKAYDTKLCKCKILKSRISSTECNKAITSYELHITLSLCCIQWTICCWFTSGNTDSLRNICYAKFSILKHHMFFLCFNIWQRCVCFSQAFTSRNSGFP